MPENLENIISRAILAQGEHKLREGILIVNTQLTLL
jgi:hypothetical protein